MPERKSTYRVPSDKVQGADSWVELYYLTNKEVRESRAGDIDDGDLISGHVAAWNWVDNEGEAMAQPDVSTLDNLLQPERWFILGALFNPDMSHLKNSETA